MALFDAFLCRTDIVHGNIQFARGDAVKLYRGCGAPSLTQESGGGTRSDELIGESFI